jgi:hypothetical protein
MRSIGQTEMALSAMIYHIQVRARGRARGGSPPPSAPRGLTRAAALAEPHGHRLQA